jgi:hypothetical protein
MVTLTQAIEQLYATRAELLDIVHRIDPADLDRKNVLGEWSIKNLLAHIAAWEAWVVQALPARLASGTTPPDLAQWLVDEDASNAEEIAEREELTPDEQLMELERNRAELLAFLRGLDAATVTRPNPWDTWPRTLPEYLLDALRDHEAAHVEALRACIATL